MSSPVIIRVARAMKGTPRSSNISLLLAVVIVAVDFIFIDKNSYFVDELYSVNASSESSVLQMLRDWVFSDVHPPLYQLVLMGWLRIFGASETATRSLSAVYYGLAVAVAYGFSRALLDKRLAGLVALVTSLAPMALFYSQETRAYAQAFLLSTVGFYLWALWRTAEVSRHVLLACFVALVLLSATHLFGVVLSGGILLFEFVVQVRRNKFRLAATIATVGLLCLTPIMPNIFIGGILENAGGEFWIGAGYMHDFKQLYGIVPIAIHPGHANGYEILLWFVLLMLASCTAAAVVWIHTADLLCLFPAKERRLLVIGFWTVAYTVTISFIISIHTPIITSRNLIVVVPQLCLIIGILGGVIAQRLPFGISVIFIVAVVAAEGISAWTWLYERRVPRDDYKDAAAFIADNCNKNSKIGSVISNNIERKDREYRKAIIIQYYYINKILEEKGRKCGNFELIYWRSIPSVIEKYDFVQIVHLRETAKKKLFGYLAKQPYQFIAVPASTEYPTLVILPQSRRVSDR